MVVMADAVPRLVEDDGLDSREGQLLHKGGVILHAASIGLHGGTFAWATGCNDGPSGEDYGYDEGFLLGYPVEGEFDFFFGCNDVAHVGVCLLHGLLNLVATCWLSGISDSQR